MLALPLHGQERRTTAAETRFVKTPNGVHLATVEKGAPLAVRRTEGNWAEVALEGWIWAASTRRDRSGRLELVVSERAGENLRAEPNGAIVARLQYGALLDRLEVKGDWVRVRRVGWVPVRGLALAERREGGTAGREAGRRDGGTAEGRAGGRGEGDSARRESRGAAGQVRGDSGVSAGDSGAGNRVEVAAATALYSEPDAGRIGGLDPGASGRVLGRTGEWVRVQLEGWVRESDLKRAAAGALVGVSASEVRADPERYVGQTVEWRLEYLAVERADELRPELPAGQPYLLARGPLPEAGFVYVALDQAQAAQLRELQPLEEVVVRARIRAARTRYLATPVLELIELVDRGS